MYKVSLNIVFDAIPQSLEKTILYEYWVPKMLRHQTRKRLRFSGENTMLW